MSEQKNSMINCLGKSLKTELKSISVCKASYFDSSNKELNKQTTKQVICLGVDKFYFIQGNLKHLIEYFLYDEIEGIEIDYKNTELFTIWLNAPSLGSRHKLRRILISAKFRGLLIKNILCYHSIYYLMNYLELKEAKLALSNYDKSDEIKQKLGIKKGLSKLYRQIQSKEYEYFIKYYLIDNYNNTTLHISYDDVPDSKDTKESKKLFNNKVPNQINECILNVEISDVYNYSFLESDLNSKDLFFYSYNYALNYLKNLLKIKRFWILKSKIFNKKINFNEDLCMWEGWKIEVRASEPYYLNIIFIILRRKFLPPLFDSYQCFHFILTELYRREAPDINPKCYEIIELAANSISYSSKMNEKDYLLFLQLKMESLLVDEETLFFFQNTLNIIPNDIYEIGFTLLYSILIALDSTLKDKTKVNYIKQVLEQKIKLLNLAGNGFNIDLASFSDKVNLNINDIFDRILSLYSPSSKLNELKEELERLNDDSNKETYDFSDKDQLISKIRRRDVISKALIAERSKIEVWKRKSCKFLTFCLNGGLSDFMFTLESLFEYMNKIQNSQLFIDLNELIYKLLCITDTNIQMIDEFPKVYIPSLNERSEFIYNEDLMHTSIKEGWLSKYLSENPKHFPQFLKLLIKKHLSVKLLSSINNHLKSVNDQMNEEGISNDEKNNYLVIIKPLIDVFTDIRQNPIILNIAAKCLINLINKKADKKNKLIIIQEEIVHSIVFYLENYDYDEKLLISSLELLKHLIPEMKSKINEYLSDINGVNLIRNFLNIMKGTRVSGAYYSQRVLAELLQVMLSLSTILEAGLKERLNSNTETVIYDSLIALIDVNKKYSLVDKNEDVSYLVEYRALYLLGILIFKNEKAKDYLYNKLHIKEFIESKAENFNSLINQVINGIKNKDGFTDNKVILITNTVKRFFEFVYYIIMKDDERVKEFKHKCVKFNSLLELLNKNRMNLHLSNEFDVYNWINRLYRDSVNLDIFN